MKSKIKLEDRLALAVSAVLVVFIVGEAVDEDIITVFGIPLTTYWGYRFVVNNLSFKLIGPVEKRIQKSKKAKK